MGEKGGKDSAVRQFANIARTASMFAIQEFNIQLGTHLNTTDKKCMVCAILYSDVQLGCVRYLCKYSALSIISSGFFLLSIDWMQR